LSKRLADGTLTGDAIALLDTIREPILRTKLYWALLGGGDDRRPFASNVLDKAIVAIESGSEPRGTTAEILASIATFFWHDDSTSLRETHQTRVETALVSRLTREAESKEPDDAILGKITVALMLRRTIPSPEQVAIAEKLLQPDRAAAVRSAGVALLAADLTARVDDPSAAGVLVQTRTTLLGVLKRETDPVVASNLIYSLARYKDAATRNLLLSIADERPDLRSKIEAHLKR